jgi:hypothetical protein
LLFAWLLTDADDDTSPAADPKRDGGGVTKRIGISSTVVGSQIILSPQGDPNLNAFGVGSAGVDARLDSWRLLRIFDKISDNAHRQPWKYTEIIQKTVRGTISKADS